MGEGNFDPTPVLRFWDKGLGDEGEPEFQLVSSVAKPAGNPPETAAYPHFSPTVKRRNLVGAQGDLETDNSGEPLPVAETAIVPRHG